MDIHLYSCVALCVPNFSVCFVDSSSLLVIFTFPTRPVLIYCDGMMNFLSFWVICFTERRWLVQLRLDSLMNLCRDFPVHLCSSLVCLGYEDIEPLWHGPAPYCPYSSPNFSYFLISSSLITSYFTSSLHLQGLFLVSLSPFKPFSTNLGISICHYIHTILDIFSYIGPSICMRMPAQVATGQSRLTAESQFHDLHRSVMVDCCCRQCWGEREGGREGGKGRGVVMTDPGDRWTATWDEIPYGPLACH